MTRDATTLKDGLGSVDLETGRYSVYYEEDKSYGVPPGNNALWGIDVSNDGRCAAYRAQDAGHGEDVWTVCADHLHSPKRITTANPQLEHYLMGSSRLIQWRSLDGRPLQGALLLPAGYQASHRYPLIVYQYPGVDGSIHLNQFGLQNTDEINMQLFATRGYAVLFPDIPVEPGAPMLDIFKAAMPAVDRVIELGVADPDRLGVTGISFGGYGVLSMIVQTKRFAAAVDISGGYVNQVSQYGSMDANGDSPYVKLSERWMGGTLWDRRDRYIENSPVFYLDRVTTPLLIINGSLDNAARPFEAEELFVFLRRLKNEVQYAKYEGEGHGLNAYANRADFLTRTIAWFDDHLKASEDKTGH
jgi:dipeptidyl aminopeptidase/acylaminoacyl peptidase